MSYLLVSVNHQTASLNQLAALTLSGDQQHELNQRLVQSESIDEAVVLSTCNRTELYLNVSRFHPGLHEALAELAAICGLSVSTLQSGCAVKYEIPVVQHIFNVAAGLSSMIIGEQQILGQLRSALASAQTDGSAGPELNALFQTALRVGKRVQTQTTIGGTGRSMINLALATQGADNDEISPFAARSVLIIGAGTLASHAARRIADLGANVTIVNRTLANGEKLAAEVSGRAAPWSDLDHELRTAQLVISCVGARELLITKAKLQDSLVESVIDLGMPPDAESDLGQVTVLNLQKLKDIADPADAAAVEQAQHIVAEEVAAFETKTAIAAVTPTVVALRALAAEVVNQELSRLSNRVDLDHDQQQEVAQTVHRITEKLLHRPTVRVKELASENSVDYPKALAELFSLDPALVQSVSDLER